MPALRLAVLIGVKDYPHFGWLDTPYQDVACLRQCLAALGFDVIERAQNVGAPITKSVMVQAIEDARSRLAADPRAEGGDAPSVIFYFAGHGLSLRGRNYLLSDNFDPEDPAAFTCEALDLEREVATALAVRTDVQSVLLIDACRNEYRGPRATGEAFVEPPFLPGRTLIGFSTSPGQVAVDEAGYGQSPYSRALSDLLPVRNTPIQLCLSAVREAVSSTTSGRQFPTYSDYGVDLMVSGSVEADHRLPEGLSIAPTPSLPGPRRAFTDQEVAAQPHHVHLFRAKASGRPAYYAVLVEPAFEKAFEQAMHQSGSATMELENYGVVLGSCYGEGPTPELCAYLLERYGFDISSKRQASATPSSRAPVPTPASRPLRPLVFALRQHLGFGAWRHLVIVVPDHEQMRFASALDELTALDRGGLGANGRGILGAARKIIDAGGASLFNIEAVNALGNVIHRGSGAQVPHTIQTKVAKEYGVFFDWKEWEEANVAMAKLPSGIQ